MDHSSIRRVKLYKLSWIFSNDQVGIISRNCRAHYERMYSLKTMSDRMALLLKAL